jgi:hypothetical protein
MCFNVSPCPEQMASVDVRRSNLPRSFKGLISEVVAEKSAMTVHYGINSMAITFPH